MRVRETCNKVTAMKLQSFRLVRPAWPAVLVLAMGQAWANRVCLSEEQASGATEALAFRPAGMEFRFDTGVLRGTLRSQGRSLGLTGVVDVASGKLLAGAYGLVSHYRLLAAETRYGTAGWDWPSQAHLLPDGAVEVRWSADATHPFQMKATYRWATADTLDVTTEVASDRPLRRFEVFLASYFSGFPVSMVYARPAENAQPEFVLARKERGVWQAFPRDGEAVGTIQDGRWQRPPHPVQWVIMPRLAVPLAMRRDPESGVVALLMAPRNDCFAICTPFGEEGHRSVYLSLFGRDIGPGQTATACARLVIARNLTPADAVQRYEAYTNPTAR